MDLENDMNTLAAKFPNFTPAELLQATAAAYNLGIETYLTTRIRLWVVPETITAAM
jgi:hypothetical protein